jgi:hypothetical protein
VCGGEKNLSEFFIGKIIFALSFLEWIIFKYSNILVKISKDIKKKYEKLL